MARTPVMVLIVLASVLLAGCLGTVKNPINDDDALLCLYCGGSLKRNVGFLGGMKYSAQGAIIAIAAGLVIAAFILLLVF